MSTIKDETGKQYGRLTVLEIWPERYHHRTAFKCLCECGTVKIVPGYVLREGLTRSCGCLSRETSRTHGCSGPTGRRTSEYGIWAAMIQRCENEKNAAYHNYGGRGIRICESWRGSFEAFLADMGKRPSERHSIDRINVNGNYEPSNCRWATTIEQGRNTRTVKMTPETAGRIRARKAQGATNMAIGREFGIHNSVVSRICNGKSWT